MWKAKANVIVIERCQVRKIRVQSDHLLAKKRQYDPEVMQNKTFFSA